MSQPSVTDPEGAAQWWKDQNQLALHGLPRQSVYSPTGSLVFENAQAALGSPLLYPHA